VKLQQIRLDLGDATRAFEAREIRRYAGRNRHYNGMRYDSIFRRRWIIALPPNCARQAFYRFGIIWVAATGAAKPRRQASIPASGAGNALSSLIALAARRKGTTRSKLAALFQPVSFREQPPSVDGCF
jgi:hypothetical protein